jgi:hypothetical protein
MTLILTLLSPTRVVQVSDRRLTDRKGRRKTEFEAPGQTDQTVAKELVSVVRMANRHPEYGKYIGRDCMAVRIQDDSVGVEADTHKENSIMHDWPIMVTEQSTVSGSGSMTQTDDSEESG